MQNIGRMNQAKVCCRRGQHAPALPALAFAVRAGLCQVLATRARWLWLAFPFANGRGPKQVGSTAAHGMLLAAVSIVAVRAGPYAVCSFAADHVAAHFALESILLPATGPCLVLVHLED